MIPVVTEHPDLAADAAILAEWLNQQRGAADLPDSTCLRLTESGLMLHSDAGSLQIDWLNGGVARRGAHVGGERLVKALGRRGPRGARVLDATAGLGRDGFLLAQAGCKVTLLERNPVLFVMLRAALEAALRDPLAVSAAERIQLVYGDSVNWMQTTTQELDIVYLDPMFPARSKSAAVKKEAKLLQMLTHGEPVDDAELLREALNRARERVIVKRPLHAPHLGGRKPDYSLSGRSTRFDVLLSPQR